MGRRLAAAFAVVVLLAVGLLGGLAWRTTGRQIASLAARATTRPHATSPRCSASLHGGRLLAQADLYSAQLLAARAARRSPCSTRRCASVTGYGRIGPALER